MSVMCSIFISIDEGTQFQINAIALISLFKNKVEGVYFLSGSQYFPWAELWPPKRSLHELSEPVNLFHLEEEMMQRDCASGTMIITPVLESDR